MPDSDRIVIELIGSAEDHDDVRLQDLVGQLSAIDAALRQTETMLSGADPTLYYRVVALSHSSPTRIAIEPVRRRDATTRAHPRSVVREFGRSLNRLQRARKPPKKMPVSTVRAYGEIGSLLTKNVRHLKITTPPQKTDQQQLEINIDSNFNAHITELLEAEDTVVKGSVTGWLDLVSLRRRNQFEIYPSFGQPKIQCTFSDELLGKIRAALGHFVTVDGEVRYKPWGKFPHSVKAVDIDPHESDIELPTLDSIRGMAPGATEEASEDFIAELRHESWR